LEEIEEEEVFIEQVTTKKVHGMFKTQKRNAHCFWLSSHSALAIYSWVFFLWSPAFIY